MVARLVTDRRSRAEAAARRLHFLHIGKTGGTAVKQCLQDYADGTDYELLLHGHDVTLRDVARGEKILFVIRDPLTRFVSGFNGRLREDLPRYHYPWKDAERIAFERFATPDDLARALSSDDREERLAAEHAMRNIGHVNTPYSYWSGDERTFRKRLPDIFFIAVQDRLDDDFELLKRKLGFPADARLPSEETAAHRTPRGFSQYLSDEARANLELWYAKDVEFVELCGELAPSLNGR
jgi:Sulfotransferase family